MKLSSLVTLLFAVATLTPLACKSSKPTSENTDAVDSSRLCRVTFNGDSAMNYARAQCDFGPRTPNSAALKKCGDYIVGRFKALGLTVTEQRTMVTGWDGKQLGCRNIIAAFHPERKDRVVIAAHYDSRPWAEKDADSSRHHTPVMAADDGASGEAVFGEGVFSGEGVKKGTEMRGRGNVTPRLAWPTRKTAEPWSTCSS